MEAAARAMEEATKRMEEAASSQQGPTPRSLASSTGAVTTTTPALSKAEGDHPLKRLAAASEEEKLMAAHMGMPNAHLKITSRSKYLS